MKEHNLQPDRIVQSIRTLHQRIGERFPDSGLQRLGEQLGIIAENMQSRAEWIGRPVAWLRALTWVVCGLIVIITLLPFYFLGKPDAPTEAKGSFSYQIGKGDAAEKIFGSAELHGFDFAGNSEFVDVVTLMESGINDIVLIGAAIFFLLSFETRYKRKRALGALHELRSIAHVIDMHQLTKDPHRIMSKQPYQKTGLSPSLNMSEFQLRRYLDYCVEMLSLTGKIAAVYVQEFDDGVALQSASELETLTTGLSSKIWQKIAILHTVETEDPVEDASVPTVVPIENLPKD